MRRKEKICPNERLFISCQYELASISRSAFYYQEGRESPFNLLLTRLMWLVSIQVIYEQPKTTERHPMHHVYHYLLQGLAITRPNQVWRADITDLPQERGFLYLVAIMDCRVLSWRIRNSMGISFCMEALEEAMGRNGMLDIFNADQGSQFTSYEWTSP